MDVKNDQECFFFFALLHFVIGRKKLVPFS